MAESGGPRKDESNPVTALVETSHFDVRPYLWCRTGRTFPGICCQSLKRAAQGCPEHLHSSIVQNGPCVLIAVNTRVSVCTQLLQVMHVPALPEHHSVLTHIQPLGKLCSQSENQAREVLLQITGSSSSSSRVAVQSPPPTSGNSCCCSCSSTKETLGLSTAPRCCKVGCKQQAGDCLWKRKSVI